MKNNHTILSCNCWSMSPAHVVCNSMSRFELSRSRMCCTVWSFLASSLPFLVESLPFQPGLQLRFLLWHQLNLLVVAGCTGCGSHRDPLHVVAPRSDILLLRHRWDHLLSWHMLLTVHFLRDSLLPHHVAWQNVQLQALHLRMALGGDELVACGGAAATVDMSLFPPGIPLNQTGTFSLLGAPIGDGSFCNQFTTSERVAKALPLLDALAVLPDAQTALLLLRHCASHCRMADSIRVTPPDGLGPSLEAFNN